MGDGGASSFVLRAGRRRFVGIVLSLAIVVTIAILAIHGGSDGTEPTEVGTAPHLVEAGDLSALADSLGHPLYWAGPPREGELELTQDAEGSVYLRYLPPGVAAGDPRPGFLTVGTYPVAEAQAAVRRLGAKAGSRPSRVAGGGQALVNPDEPNSVYLAYPESDLQIEVYDPEPGRALSLIRSGAIGSVE